MISRTTDTIEELAEFLNAPEGFEPCESDAEWQRSMQPTVTPIGEDNVYTWELSKSRYPEIDDVKVALDEAGFAPDGHYGGPGCRFVEPMDFTDAGDMWQVEQCAKWDV